MITKHMNGRSGQSLTKLGNRVSAGSSPPLRVHFTDDTITYDPDFKVNHRRHPCL